MILDMLLTFSRKFMDKQWNLMVYYTTAHVGMKFILSLVYHNIMMSFLAHSSCIWIQVIPTTLQKVSYFQTLIHYVFPIVFVSDMSKKLWKNERIIAC